MKAEKFVSALKDIGIESVAGVPDSTLKQFCDYINTDGKDELKHYVTANEGAAAGLAAGIYLGSGKPAAVYMQNSGLGNIVNPVTSIANTDVYGIPMLFIIGWRGEPGVHDEPQHKFMGKITDKMCDLLDIPYSIIDKDTTGEELEKILSEASRVLSSCRQYALIVKKGTFDKRSGGDYANAYTMIRENAVRTVVESLGDNDLIVSTTGKISREVYEQLDMIYGDHSRAFLTVGGMGHASMIAYGIAEERPDKNIFCLDGDGAALMHMGSIAFIGQNRPDHFVHICFNNGAHESVGGMPTGTPGLSFSKIATDSGYDCTVTVRNEDELKAALAIAAEKKGLYFIEALVAASSRDDLGRPKESAAENKTGFMTRLRGEEG
ncbi:MAG: phosphonopyruvate decarboxylase [Clostridiales bacterium]|nr:phosphonopyruvate decarboxylase [Clostridiales bacterium]